MAESFTNSITRAAGIVTSTSAGAIGITTNKITGISTVGIAVSDLVDTDNYILGTKIQSVGASQVVCDRDSTNTSASTSQSIKFLGPTTAYTSASGNKSILVGGTFANNTGNEVNVTVTLYDNSAGTEVGIAQKIPVPNGSSFVISDAGKTVMESLDQIVVYCDTANAIDATLSVLKGVS